MSIRSLVEQFFVLITNDSEKRDFRDTLTRQNVSRMQPVAIMTLTIELVMFARTLFRAATDTVTMRTYAYMALYLVMALMMCFTLIMIRLYRADPESGLKWAGFLAPLGTATALLWAAAITLVDMAGTNQQAVTFVAMQYLMMVVFVISPGLSLTLLLSVQGLFIAGVYLMLDDPSAYGGILINTFINALLAWLVSRVMYSSALKQYRSNHMVQEKNEQLRRLNERLAELSVTDPLTMLMNRRHFDDIAEQEWRRACREEQRLTIAIGDVDDFKQYNDIYGHQDGDACLRRVADAMRGELRRANDTLARFGGEEFIILLRSGGEEKDEQLLERVREAVASMRIPHSGSRAADHVTISIGGFCAVPKLDSLTIDKMIKAADDALYDAKDGGRNRVVFRYDK